MMYPCTKLSECVGYLMVQAKDTYLLSSNQHSYYTHFEEKVKMILHQMRSLNGKLLVKGRGRKVRRVDRTARKIARLYKLRGKLKL